MGRSRSTDGAAHDDTVNMPRPRRRPPKKAGYHHGDLRRALIDTALDIVAKQGPGAVSLRGLAQRLGVSHAAPYRHFRDKESLLAALAEEGFRQFREALEAARDRAGSDARERLLATGVAYVQFATSHRSYFAVMFSHLGAPPPDVPGLALEGGSAFTVLLDAITAAQRAGAVRDGDPMPLAIFAWSSVHGLATLLVERCLEPLGIDATPAALAKPLVEDILVGLGPR
jgi:AcrR family transcriptional regulator